MTEQTQTRSPIRDSPLRQAGQSLVAKINECFEEGLAWFAMLAFSLGIFLGVLGGHFLARFYPYPQIASFLLVLSTVWYFVGWIRTTIPMVSNLTRGLDGERAVAECLDELRAHGYRVFHDIPSQRDGGANVDHLAIGPGGIFVIETKTRRKPTGRDARVTFDGETLLIDGYVPDRDPIGQVCAVSREIGEWLRLDTGQEVASLIKPVVVFPGWYVADPRRIRDRPIWVLNDRALNKIIRKEDERLSPGDIALFSSRIEQRVRRHQAEALRRP